MKSEITECAGCTKKLHIEVERERFEQQVIATLKNVRKEIQMPGFRKGKAPEEMILRRFGASVREEAVRDMIPKVLEDAFAEQGIKPIGEPHLSDLRLEEDGPVVFTVTVEELPEIDLGGFTGLAVTKDVVEVADADVDASLARLCRMRATQEEVDREVRDGDIIMANLQKLDAGGAALIGERMENQVIHLDGRSTPSPDFDRQVMGMKKGETRNIQFTYDESIGNPELVGTTEGYAVEVTRVFENRIPELNEEFAKSLGGYADLADLREKTHAGLARQFEGMSDRKLRGTLIDEFVRQTPFEVPNSMVERVIHSEIERLKEQYPGEAINEEEAHSQMRADAVRAVQTYIILDAVKESQGFEISRDELNARIDEMAAARNANPKELRRTFIKEGRYDELRHEIEQDRAYEWMRSAASVKEVVVPREAPESKIVTP